MANKIEYKGETFEIVQNNSRKEGFQILISDMKGRFLLFAGDGDIKTNKETIYFDGMLEKNEKGLWVIPSHLDNIMNDTWVRFCD